MGPMARIDAIIKKNYAKESFSVNDLMTDAGVSRTSFTSKLKSLVGMSAREYINHFRPTNRYRCSKSRLSSLGSSLCWQASLFRTI